ncbi:hypothetical protein As57867_003087, partial [Aphanomyces stellatus]
MSNNTKPQWELHSPHCTNTLSIHVGPTTASDVAPEVRSLFRTSIIVQGKALINIIQSIIKGPITTDAVGGVVDFRHNKYGVKMQYYNILGRVLLLTLGECTGSEFWTSDLELAWRTVYAYMMTAMSPILYHGVTEPTELDKAMAKRGEAGSNEVDRSVERRLLCSP